MKVAITGAAGFVGRAVVDSVLRKGVSVAVLVREHSAIIPDEVEQIQYGDLADLALTEYFSTSQGGNVKAALHDVDVVIHLAARVHIMDDFGIEPLAEYKKVNTYATLALAQQAAEAGVKRFIFISSIKVNGEKTQPNQPFKADDFLIPTDPYGLSKYEAEQGLLKLAKETGMEVVIIRPPLVYGPGVKANFSSMMKWINKGVPLPFGAINNQRSFVALDNLVSFIIHCIEHPKAANEIFLISDDKDASTTELLRKVANAFEVKSRLLPIPVSLMTVVAKILGKGDMANRLFGSLQVDISKAKNLLGWSPVTTMDEQLKKTADAYIPRLLEDAGS